MRAWSLSETFDSQGSILAFLLPISMLHTCKSFRVMDIDHLAREVEPQVDKENSRGLVVKVLRNFQTEEVRFEKGRQIQILFDF